MHTITHKANSIVRPLYMGIARPNQLRDFCLTSRNALLEHGRRGLRAPLNLPARSSGRLPYGVNRRRNAMGHRCWDMG